jgi:hypothetical protein
LSPDAWMRAMTGTRKRRRSYRARLSHILQLLRIDTAAIARLAWRISFVCFLELRAHRIEKETSSRALRDSTLIIGLIAQILSSLR